MRNQTNTRLFIYNLYSTIALTGEIQDLERISILINLYEYKKNILIYLYKSKRFGI